MTAFERLPFKVTAPPRLLFPASAAALGLAFLSFSMPAAGAPRADGQLELSIVEAQTGQPLAARVHLRSTRNRPVRLGLPGTSEHAEHFYVDGKLVLPGANARLQFPVVSWMLSRNKFAVAP